MKIERFEDINAWQEARELSKSIYMISKAGEFSKDFGLRDQIRRASVSIMANIAEGFDSQSDAEFIKFLGYARRSATEVQSHLYVALDQVYVPEEQFKVSLNKTQAVKSILSGFIRYLRKSPGSRVKS